MKSRPELTAIPEIPNLADPAAEPWIESPEGQRFFGLLLFSMPLLVVAVPFFVRAVVDSLVTNRDPSPFLDTIPAMAMWALPRFGWLSVIPIWFGVRAIRLGLPRRPRNTVLVLILGYGWVGLFAVQSMVTAWR